MSPTIPRISFFLMVLSFDNQNTLSKTPFQSISSASTNNIATRSGPFGDSGITRAANFYEWLFLSSLPAVPPHPPSFEKNHDKKGGLDNRVQYMAWCLHLLGLFRTASESHQIFQQSIISFPRKMSFNLHIATQPTRVPKLPNLIAPLIGPTTVHSVPAFKCLLAQDHTN